MIENKSNHYIFIYFVVVLHFVIIYDHILCRIDFNIIMRFSRYYDPHKRSGDGQFDTRQEIHIIFTTH